jgi:cbb3-type cytochrome oxidase subunit 3
MMGFDPTSLISLCCSLFCCVLFLVAIIGGILFVLRRGKKADPDEAPKAKADAKGNTKNAAKADSPKKLDEKPIPAPTVAPMPPPMPDEDDSPTVVAPPPPGMAEPPPPPPAEPEKKKKSKAGQTIIAFDDEDDEDF